MTSHRSCTPVRDDSLRGRHARSGEDRLSSVASDERYSERPCCHGSRGPSQWERGLCAPYHAGNGKAAKAGARRTRESAALCDWYASNGPRLIADEPTTVENDKVYVSYLDLSLLGLIRLRAGRFVCIIVRSIESPGEILRSTEQPVRHRRCSAG